MNKKCPNILVIRTDRIGDIILTTPVFQEIRRIYPGAKITVLVSSLTKDLIQGNPFVDEVLVDERSGRHKGIGGFFSLAFDLRSRKFDLAIVYHTKKRTNALGFIAGIPVRVGYKNNKYGFLLTHPVEDIRIQGMLHESQYCLKVLDSLPGVTARSEPISLESIGDHLYVSRDRDSDAWADILFEKKGIEKNPYVIAIHPGASDKEKTCSPEFFAEVSEGLIHRYNAAIIIVGARNVKDDAAAIRIHIQEKYRKSVVDLVGETSLDQLVSLLRKTSLLISNDSGPVHVAAALKTRVISLFVRNEPGINPERWHPLGKFSRYLAVPANRDADKVQDVRKSLFLSGLKNPEWQEFITKDRILEEVDSLFKL